jgi:hypothetical protein
MNSSVILCVTSHRRQAIGECTCESSAPATHLAGAYPIFVSTQTLKLAKDGLAAPHHDHVPSPHHLVKTHGLSTLFAWRPARWRARSANRRVIANPTPPTLPTKLFLDPLREGCCPNHNFLGQIASACEREPNSCRRATPMGTLAIFGKKRTHVLDQERSVLQCGEMAATGCDAILRHMIGSLNPAARRRWQQVVGKKA